MPYSVIATLDSNLGVAVEKMWETLASIGIASEGEVQGNHPHITLGVYNVANKCVAASKAIRDLAAVRQGANVTLSGYGIFPGERCTLWAVPIVTRELLALHRELHGSVTSDDPHYAPDRWVPHVTLARELAAATAIAGLDALAPAWQGPHGTLARIELISFVPVVVLGSYSFESRR